MFDATGEYVLNARTEEGNKTQVTVRWPSDQEWSDRKKAIRFITTQLGRGRSETEPVPSPETDLRIYEAIKLNGAPALSGDEAGRLLDRLGRCEVRNVEMEGNGAMVTLAVLGGEVKHTVKVPTAKQSRMMREAAAKLRQLPHNRVEARISLDPPAKLWEECGGKSGDYINGIIPAPHKDVAIRAVIEELDNELASALEENDDF